MQEMMNQNASTTQAINIHDADDFTWVSDAQITPSLEYKWSENTTVIQIRTDILCSNA